MKVFSLQRKIILNNKLILPSLETNYDTITNVNSNINPKGNEIITWLMAVYNRKNIVSQTIDSLLNQTNKNWKCIICDDGSTDGSYEYIIDYIKDDKRFTVYKKNNEGYVKTCRFMNDKATTDVVAIIDSDDVLETKANEILTRKFRKLKCSAIYSSYYLCDGELNIKKIITPNKNNNLLIRNEFEHLRSWRKSCLSQGAFPNYINGAEDQDLAYRFEELGNQYIYVEKNPLVKFRRHNNSLMSTKNTHNESRKCHYISKITAINRRFKDNLEDTINF